MVPQLYSANPGARLGRFLPDLIRRRQILTGLVLKDLRVRYRYALIGFAWAVIEPVALTAILAFVFTVVFDVRGGAAGVDSPFHFAALILVALVPWQFLSQSVMSATTSLVDNRSLIGKVAFPREIVPLANVGYGLVNFVIGYAVLMLAVFGIEVVLVLGLALLLSCGNVFFRDVSYMVNVVLTFAFYGTPIFYFSSMIPEAYRTAYLVLNPMACLIEAYRYCIIEDAFPNWPLLAWPGAVALTVFVLGLWVFRRNAHVMADNV